jgi:transcriptional regulator with XRE-family HTH domain
VSIKPGEAAAARKLLGWSRFELAARAAISDATIPNFEVGRRPSDRKIAVIQRALEEAGVEFTNSGEPGVKLNTTIDEPFQRKREPCWVSEAHVSKIWALSPRTASLAYSQDGFGRNGRVGSSSRTPTR